MIRYFIDIFLTTKQNKCALNCCSSGTYLKKIEKKIIKFVFYGIYVESLRRNIMYVDSWCKITIQLFFFISMRVPRL